MKRFLPHCTAIVCITLLAACGGGGGDSGSSSLNNSSSGSSASTTISFSLGGTVSGLPGGGSLTLLYNGAGSNTISANGPFTLMEQVTSGSSYNVTLGTQPTGYSCAISGGSGTVTSSQGSGVAVTCSQITVSLGGSVSGLGNTNGLSLTDQVDTLPIEAGATTFTFPTRLAEGTTYTISVANQPSGETCSVAGGSGTTASAGISNAVVTCSDRAYTLGGAVHGLNAPGLVLANGSDTLVVGSGSTTFTMPGSVAYTSSYALTVKTQPAGLACSVANAGGTMPANNVTNILVSCTDRPFSLGGTITGLGSRSGLVLANGSDTLNVPAGSTSFTLPAGVPYSATYSVTVSSAPAGLICSVSNGSGTMPASAVSNVAITCATQSYTIGGSISGLTVAGLQLANGPDTLIVAANAAGFTMPMALAYGSPYAVTVQTQPANYTCTVSNGSGNVGSAPVTNITVSCAQSAFTIGGTISGLTHNGLILANGTDTLAAMANATTFTMPTVVATGANYNVLVQATPPALACSVNNGSGMVASSDVSNVAVSCAPGTESVLDSFGGTPDGAYPFYGNGIIQATDGNFYGTIHAGGGAGFGAVFELTAGGTESVIYAFQGSGANDGANPAGTIIQAADGNFYGMTQSGGTYNNGAIFKLTPSGTETVLYSFAGGLTDGVSPYGSLVQGTDGNFYGMTLYGGAYGSGVVFQITSAGTETVLYSFGATASDGSGPYGSLIQASDGNFYGMTYGGGTAGLGTVFKVTPTGVETVLYSFGGGADGSNPGGSLVQGTDGNFYGMTQTGGASNDGVVFRITPTGAETVIYNFVCGGGDGANPQSGTLLLGSDGNFYGLTYNGGVNSLGTLFEVTPSGTETVLWSFGAGTDGASPYGSLIQGTNGTLYGLTSVGGTYAEGVIFQFN